MSKSSPKNSSKPSRRKDLLLEVIRYYPNALEALKQLIEWSTAAECRRVLESNIEVEINVYKDLIYKLPVSERVPYLIKISHKLDIGDRQFIFSYPQHTVSLLEHCLENHPNSYLWHPFNLRDIPTEFVDVLLKYWSVQQLVSFNWKSPIEFALHPKINKPDTVIFMYQLNSLTTPVFLSQEFLGKVDFDEGLEISSYAANDDEANSLIDKYPMLINHICSRIRCKLNPKNHAEFNDLIRLKSLTDCHYQVSDFQIKYLDQDNWKLQVLRVNRSRDLYKLIMQAAFELDYTFIKDNWTCLPIEGLLEYITDKLSPKLAEILVNAVNKHNRQHVAKFIRLLKQNNYSEEFKAKVKQLNPTKTQLAKLEVVYGNAQ